MLTATKDSKVDIKRFKNLPEAGGCRVRLVRSVSKFLMVLPPCCNSSDRGGLSKILLIKRRTNWYKCSVASGAVPISNFRGVGMPWQARQTFQLQSHSWITNA